MILSGEEEVMFDVAKGNLWLLLMLQELQEKEVNVLRQKKYLKH